MMMSMVRSWIQDKRLSKSVTLLLVLMIIWSFVSPAVLSATAGFGGYISEKLLGDGTNEALYFGNGTNDLTVLGSSSVVSTVGATSSSAGNTVTMVMAGNLQSLNGMPRADVWFRWGYAPGAMVFTTSTVTVTSTGVQTASINPNAGSTVYYQFASSTDGTAYGSVLSLVIAVSGGHGVSYWMMNTLLPIIVAAIILISVLMLTGNPLIAFTASIVGLTGFYIILALVSSF